MPTVKLRFCDIAPDWDPRDNYFTQVLERHGWQIDQDSEPDFVLCGTFGHQFLEYSCIRIQFSGEDSWPDLNLYDYAMGYPLLDYEGRYLRLPLYAMRDSWAPALQKHTMSDEAYLNRPQFCSFVVSNDYAQRRNRFFEELNAHRPVASGGRYQNNVGGPVEDKHAFLLQSRFNIAYENSATEYYCTEKIVDAFAAGCVPVYWGDPRVLDEFNPDAFLWAEDYPDNASLIAAMDEIDADPQRYLSYCRAPILRPGCRAEQYADDHLCLEFLEGIFRSKTFRRNLSMWGIIYEGDLKYLYRQAEQPKGLLAQLKRRVLGR